MRWLLARPEKELAVVSHPAFLHHLTNAGYAPLKRPPVEVGLHPRLRRPSPPTPPYAAHSARFSGYAQLVAYPSPHMERTLRPPFETCEMRVVAVVPN